MGDGSFLLRDLHFNGCDGLVALPGGFEASTPPLCWPTRSYCSLGSFIPVASGLQSVAVGVFFIFGDLLSTPHFPILCCRPESNTDRPNPACTTVWTKDILSKRKGIYILKGYFSFPPRRQGNAKKKKKTLLINSIFNLIKYKFCHCLLT